MPVAVPISFHARLSLPCLLYTSNISDRVYLGLTIGAYDVNYSKISTYGEEYGDCLLYTSRCV